MSKQIDNKYRRKYDVVASTHRRCLWQTGRFGLYKRLTRNFFSKTEDLIRNHWSFGDRSTRFPVQEAHKVVRSGWNFLGHPVYIDMYSLSVTGVNPSFETLPLFMFNQSWQDFTIVNGLIEPRLNNSLKDGEKKSTCDVLQKQEIKKESTRQRFKLSFS